jgi:hypothetical protein
MNRRLLLLCVLPAAVTLACEDHCDEDQILQDNACHPKPKAAIDSGTPDTPKTDGGSAEGGSTGDASSKTDAGGGSIDPGYGRTCANDAGCSGVANYCALAPGAKEGYCTSTFAACPAPVGACPPGWGCFDVNAMFGLSGYPAFCSKP